MQANAILDAPKKSKRRKDSVPIYGVVDVTTCVHFNHAKRDSENQ